MMSEEKEPAPKKRTKVAAPAKAKEKKPKKKEEQPYILPRGCEESTVLLDILNYRCFEHEDKVYVMRDKFAVAVSNFTCSIRMHVNGEHPTRLISIRNEEKHVEVMHVAHDVFNTLPSFKKTVTAKGNYQWRGTEGDYQLYLWRMMDLMGHGRMILEQGMQPEGFFAFSNKILDGPNKLDLDEFGCFERGDRTYYMPASHSEADEAETANSKRVSYRESPVTWDILSYQQRLVHGAHSFLGQVHAVGTVFSDIIRDRMEGFPIPCYYGPPGTGKDQIVKANQRLYGRPQKAIRLSGSNTAPAIVNVFAEFRGLPLYLTEWHSGLKEEMHHFVMGIWDGEGRRRGTRIQAGRSRYGTEDIPIRCTASVSTNEYPNHLDQLLDRLVVSEMKKLQPTMEQRANYTALADMAKAGYSYLLHDIVKHREAFVRDWFTGSYEPASAMVHLALGDKFISERMRTNMTILISVHHFFSQPAHRLPWSFTTDELTAYLRDAMLAQQRRRLSGDMISEFWTCFVAAINQQQLRRDKHFKLDVSAGTIAFYWTDMQAQYLEQHRRIFGTPGKRDILVKLQEHQAFIRGKNKMAHEAYRIGDRKSTAYVFDVREVGTDLLGLIATEEEQTVLMPF